jgi:anti-anti-sigma regulatory factor
MELHVTTYHGRVVLSVLRLNGRLDATTYTSLIETGKRLFGDGVRKIVLDLAALTYISSAGLMALQAVAALLAGSTVPDPDAGWDALHQQANAMAETPSAHLKLLNPQPQVLKTFERVRFTTLFDIYSTLDDAIAACLPLTDRRGLAQGQMRYVQAFNPDLPKNRRPTNDD